MKPHWKLTLYYLLFGYFWILASDAVLLAFFSKAQLEEIAIIQSLKGLFYVSITAFTLYLLLKRHYKLLNEKIIELEDKNEKLLDIAWTQSHVFRSPLTRIQGIVNILEENKLTEEEKVQFLKHLKESVNELDGLTRKIITRTSNDKLNS